MQLYLYPGMKIEDEDAALQAIRDNAQDKERIQMISLLKGLLPDERKDLWHGLTPEDLVGVLRSRLESGGLEHVLRFAEEPLRQTWIFLITCAHYNARPPIVVGTLLGSFSVS